MEDFNQIIALITAGAAFITALNSLYIGLHRERNRLDLLFGIQSAILFTFLILPPTGFILNESPDDFTILAVKRIFLWSYYGIFPFFLEAYSGYRKPVIRWMVIGVTILTYIMYLVTPPETVNPIWRILVLIPLGLNLVYGILGTRYQKKTGDKRAADWLAAAMTVYALLFTTGFLRIYFGITVEYILGMKLSFNFNLNPLAFIIIMSVRLSSHTFKSYRLERILRLQNNRWEQLLNNMPMPIVELDREGKILYINPYGCDMLGYGSQKELSGKNWIDKFVKPQERDQVRKLHAKNFEEGPVPQDIRVTVLGANGEDRNIRWYSVLIIDESRQITGVLSVGSDTTDLDRAFEQVENLKNELQKENILLKEVLAEDLEGEIIGKSEAIIYAIQKARQVAGTHASVLLEGETGVGKELFANMIHRLSGRSTKPLIKVNCAALPAELIESELFGHEKGSFTGAVQARKGRFELADGGTIFLDEIGEMPLSLQPKLLRVLQSGEFERVGGQHTIKVDVRVISATNRDLSVDVNNGLFREDLYYRLNVFPITIPSLKDRKEDIPVLVEHFINKYSQEFNRSFENMSRSDMNRLLEYEWPGNIRELMNVIERSVISSPDGTLKLFWEHHVSGNGESPKPVLGIRDLEKEHILKVLRESNWKINGENGAAEKLGLHPNTLRSRMKKLDINRENG